jgi:5-formyltetrahydrofolate cyclo-ligase
VLAPALAVARDGSRLGRGGGSYDRALARCPADAVLAAVVFDEEVVDVLPSDAWDVRVHLAVTPSGWRTLGNTGMQIRR